MSIYLDLSDPQAIDTFIELDKELKSKGLRGSDVSLDVKGNSVAQHRFGCEE